MELQIDEAFIGWSRGTAFVSAGIRYLEKSYFNHVYFRFNLNNGMVLIYESHISGGVQITPYEHLESAVASGKVADKHELSLNLPASMSQSLWEDCIPLHGDAYDKRQILVYYAWIRFLHMKPESKLFKINKKDKYTCNEFVVQVGRQVVPEMSMLDFSYTPERLFKVFHGGMGSKEWKKGLRHSILS